jgi:integrase
MDIAEWRNKRTGAGKAPTTIKNALMIISQVYMVASSEWGMEGLRNPVRGVRMPGNRAPRDRRPEPGEEGRLMGGCQDCGNPWIRPIAMWAIETAMRQGEILGLARPKIRGSVVILPDTKNGRSRSVPLSTRALGILSGLPVSLHGPVFPITQDSLECYWRKACGIAGIEDLHFHDLRHEATSRLFERGLNPFEVMAITGHSTTDMLKRYTHFFAGELALKLG